MRFRNVPLGAIVLLVAAGIVYSRDPSLVERLLPARSGPGTVAAAAPAAPAFVMPVPVTRAVKRSIPIVLDYSARTESIRGIALQAKVSAFVLTQTVPDGTDVKRATSSTSSIVEIFRSPSIKPTRRSSGIKPRSIISAPVMTGATRSRRAAIWQRTISSNARVRCIKPRRLS